METLLFYSLVLLLLLYVGKALLTSGIAIMELPSIFALVVLIWCIPQLFAIRLLYLDLETPLLILYVAIAMAVVSIRLGWSIGVSKTRRASYRLSSRYTLHYVAVVTTIIAVVTTMMIERTGNGVGGTQTGIVAILLFLNGLKVVSLFLSFFLVLRYRTRAGIALLAINLLVYTPFISLYFRRQAMMEVLSCIVLALWFARRVVLPRFLLIAIFATGYLVLSAVGEFRVRALETGQWNYLSMSEMLSAVLAVATKLSEDINHSELLNAINLIKTVNLDGQYSFGASSWNRLVFQWVPAQLVGYETKMSLMFENNIRERLFMYANHEIPTGSTLTGIADAYLELWYFGAVFYAATGYVMGRWWARAQLGDPWAMVYYVGGLGPALLTLTHSAIHFVNGILLMLIIVPLIRASLQFLPRTRRRGLVTVSDFPI